MHYKKLLVLSVLLTSCLLFVNFTYVKVAGAHPGTTGAPGDESCNGSGCHAGTVIKNDKLVNSLIFPTLDSTYVPGATYLVKVKVKNTGITRFGFQIVVLEDKANKNIGKLALTETSRTQIITHTVSGDMRYEITHVKNGTPATPAAGVNEWSFNWTAPATNVGTITMYYATNSANNNGQPSGDNIRQSTFQLKPASTTGTNGVFNENETYAFYNHDGNFIDLTYTLNKQRNISLTIMNSSGQQVYASREEQKNEGLNAERIPLPADIASGIYFINLQCESNYFTKKVFIR